MSAELMPCPETSQTSRFRCSSLNGATKPKSPATLRGQKELFAAPPDLQSFLAKRLGESELFGPIIQLPRIVADDLAARNPGHFLEDRIYKKYLIGFICDDNTVIQCLENGLHLLERLRPFAVHEISLFSEPKHV